MRVFRFIAAKKAEHSIKIMCRVLEVSRSGYHAWARREPSARAVADAALSDRIAEIHERLLKTYGSPQGACRAAPGARRPCRSQARRAADAPRRPVGADQAPARASTTIRVQGVRTAPDLVERDFNPTAPESPVVRGYHVHPDVGGLAVPGVGDGLLQPPDRRLGDGRPPARRARRRRARDGRRAPPARRPAGASLRPGQRSTRRWSSRARCRSVDIDVSMGSTRRLLRQRRRWRASTRA